MKAEEKKRKAEEKKRKDWEEKVRREEAEKKKLEDEEKRGKKRKEREWEEQREREKEEQLKKEKSERKKKEKEDKKRQEKEKEALEKEVQRKEQISTDKRRLKVDLNKVKTDFEGKIPLPVSSPKKVGKLQNVPKVDPKIDTSSTNLPEISNSSPSLKISPEKDSVGDQIDVKTPKKLRKWPLENESPDPKKNFIKKHQEEQEKLHLESIANSPKPTVPPAGGQPTVPTSAAPPNTKENLAAPALPPAQINRVEKGGEEAPARNVENSPFENLGYNSGDDVSRYSDDHLNKQLIVKPSTVLAKDGSEDEENATVKVEEPAKPAEQTQKTTEEKKVEEAIVPKVEETKGEETACLEQKMPDCMLEQQKGVTLEQQQQVQQQHRQTPMQPPQPLSQQQNAAQQYVSTMEQCAVAQQQKQLEQQQA